MTIDDKSFARCKRDRSFRQLHADALFKEVIDDAIDDEALGSLRDEVNAYRDRANHYLAELDHARHVHFARVDELSETLTQIGDSLASTERTEDNARLLRDFARFRKAMQLRLSSFTEQVESLDSQRQQANATAADLHEQLEASRKSMAVRVSELRRVRKATDLALLARKLAQAVDIDTLREVAVAMGNGCGSARGDVVDAWRNDILSAIGERDDKPPAPNPTKPHTRHEG